MTSERPTVQLDASDATELAEMLTFIGDWIASDPAITRLFEAFVGSTSYTTTALRTDLARFTFLLTGQDAARLFGGEGP